MSGNEKTIDLEAYARAWVADPERALREVGPGAPDADKALQLMDGFSAACKSLRELNESLLPMVQTLGSGEGGRGWWARFTGASLEGDVRMMHVAQNVEAVAAECRATADNLGVLMDGLRAEIALLDRQQRNLEVRVNIGRRVLDLPGHAAAFAAKAGPELVQRFQRKLVNVESLLVAQQLTRAQYELALGNGRAMLDRFDEIMTLLLPLWYQRMGFELFSQRLEAVE